MDIKRGVGVLVMQGSKVLTATRADNGAICGPGGHVDSGEDLKTAAIRETKEEFGIDISEMELLGELTGMPKEYCNSTVYLCTKYEGTPTADGIEMQDARFVELSELIEANNLFLPFKASLSLLQQKNMSVTTTFKVAKSNDSEGLVSGWANVAVNADGTIPLDWQGDVISPATLEKAAINFMMEYRDSGVMHEGASKGVVVESIVFTKEKQAAIGIPDGIVPEGWFITVKILDPEVFEQVKNGTFKMFSIQGHAKRVKL
jgi:8-oxo-dGTP pyrophosphatase MutT (NUDIX family)